VELDPDYKKVRELFTGSELGKVIKAVQNFCKANAEELVSELRYKGKITY